MKEYKLPMQMFVKSVVHDFMQCADLTDGGMKVFGTFEEFMMTSKTPITKAKQKKLITEIIANKGKEVMYIQFGNYYCFSNDKYRMFSTGKHFVFKDDILKKWEDLKELRVEVK